MKTHIRNLSLAIAVAASTAAAFATPTFQFVAPRGYAVTDVSGDGSVLVGNVVGDGSYETFRWTAAGGAERLGRGTVLTIGGGAGSPNVSNDGTHISATIADSTGTIETTGIWHGGIWDEPDKFPANSIVTDHAISDAWGLSGDGNTAVGLYWRSGGNGSASAFSWTNGNPGVPLAPITNPPPQSRANATNYNGTVTVGWTAASFGNWQPTVWKNGVATILDPTDVSCQANSVSADGSVIVGQNYNPNALRREAAMWRLQGGQYVETTLGVLPETPQTQVANVFADDVSADGNMIVGTNIFFSAGPASSQTGFFWTPSTGMVNIIDYLATSGVTVDPLFSIQSLDAVSADGHTLVGYGRWQDDGSLQSFSVTVPEPTGLLFVSSSVCMFRRRR